MSRALAKYPVLEMQLYGGLATLQIPPTNYLIDYDGQSCLALERGIGDDVVIGM